jgi:hypothetical protein
MNWKLLSATLLGLTLVACDGKKDEKKAEEGTAPDAVKVEEPKPGSAMHAETPKEEHKKEETPKEEHTGEKKAS